MPSSTGKSSSSLCQSKLLSNLATGAGVTLTVGVEKLAAISHCGSGTLNASITEVADIADPTAWTDLVSIDTGGYIRIKRNSPNYFGRIDVSDAEDADDSLRIQVRDTVRGITLFDTTCVKAGALVANYDYCVLEPIILRSLHIRACRHGSLTHGDTYVRTSLITYEELK